MVKIIKLNINGEVIDINISLKKKEKFDINLIKNQLNIINNNFKIQHSWEIENNKVLILLGSSNSNNDNDEEENFHQLPIKNNYQFYGDLYVIMVNKNIIQDLDLENFENIYNALYFEDEEKTDNSDIEEDIENIYIDQEEEEEEDLNLDNYGEDISTDDDAESMIDLEEKKKPKILKKKKIIKILETKDILYEENNPPEKYNINEREKMLNILFTLNHNNDYMRYLEMEILNFAIRDSIRRNIVPTWNILLKKIYVNKGRSLYINIKPDSYIKNKKLFERIKNQEITPKELVNMTSQDLFPENWKQLIDEKYKKNKILYETKKEAMTDQFKCRKCGSRETCYYEMQTRSADEPMTIFITCIECGNRWKN